MPEGDEPAVPEVDDLFAPPPEHDPLTASDDDLKLVWQAEDFVPDEPAPDTPAAEQDEGESGDEPTSDARTGPDPDDAAPDDDQDTGFGDHDHDEDPGFEPTGLEPVGFESPDEDPGAEDPGPGLLGGAGGWDSDEVVEPEPITLVPEGPEGDVPAADSGPTWDAFPVGPSAPAARLPGEVDDDDEVLELYAEAVELPGGIDHWDEPIVREERPRSRSEEADTESAVQEEASRPRLPRLVVAGLVVVGAIVVSLLLRSHVVQPFRSPTASMEPTIEVDELFVVNRLSYRLHEVNRGDVVVFDSPDDATEDTTGGRLVKRVVALEGEIIEARDGIVYVNDRALEEPYLQTGTQTGDIVRQVVPPDTVFVLGDNRADSEDSRVFGAVEEDSIVGRAALRIGPPSRIAGL